MAPDRAPGAPPVPPFHVRQLTIEDGLTLAASPQPGAWQVYDALEPFPPDEGYWAVADSQDCLLGFCCLGEPARAPGETGHPAVLDIAIGIRSDLSGRGWGAELGRAAVAYARSVALDRRLTHHRPGLEHRRAARRRAVRLRPLRHDRPGRPPVHHPGAAGRGVSPLAGVAADPAFVARSQRPDQPAEARRSSRSSACPDSTPVRISRATASSSATCGLVRE